MKPYDFQDSERLDYYTEVDEDFVMQFFDSNGDFKEYTDPYRSEGRACILFAGSGSLLYSAERIIEKVLQKGKYKWDSDLVRCYYAQQHGSGTKGSYPAIYMWR